MPKSRPSIPSGFISKSTPNLPIINNLSRLTNSKAPSQHVSEPHDDANGPLPQRLAHSPEIHTPSEPASIEDNVLDDDEQDSANLFSRDRGSSASSASEPEAPPQAPPKRPLYTHGSRSYTSLPPQTHSSMLFPPFYNRPPAPLPPSPSLTSLLRPSFSAHASRPTTPDSSDVEFGDTAASSAGTPISSTPVATDIKKSARLAPASIPRASPKVPTYEYYGFALYLASSAAFLMYLLWAYLPSPFLHQLGIHYYPNRWWALAVPAWLVMLIVYIYVALASYNTQYLTLRLSSCENLVDEAGAVACIDPRSGEIVKNGVLPAGVRKPSASVTVGGSMAITGKRAGDVRGGNSSAQQMRFAVGQDVDWRGLWSVGTDAVLDVPIGGVCEVLYGQGASDEESGEESEDHGELTGNRPTNLDGY